MEQKEFLEILKKYRIGNASDEEKKMIDAWYEAMGQQSGEVSGIKEKDLAENYWSYIKNHIANEQGRTLESQSSARQKVRFISYYYYIGIAASAVIAFVAFLYLANRNDATEIKKLTKVEEPVPAIWEQVSNSKNVAQRFSLSDGSQVTLEPQSWIKFPSAFDQSVREVHLEGEAFFEVAHNEQKPFFVFANGVTTKVLGTSFTVKAYKQQKDVIVSVKTGRVSVYSSDHDKSVETPAVILTPNQQIIYDKKNETVSRGIVAVPQPLLEEEEIKRMRFDAAPVKEIFEAIEKIYGVDIVFDEALFASCTLTTLVSDGGLYNRLDIVTSAIGAKYTLNESTIVVSGPGCN